VCDCARLGQLFHELSVGCPRMLVGYEPGRYELVRALLCRRISREGFLVPEERKPIFCHG